MKSISIFLFLFANSILAGDHHKNPETDEIIEFKYKLAKKRKNNSHENYIKENSSKKPKHNKENSEPLDNLNNENMNISNEQNDIIMHNKKSKKKFYKIKKDIKEKLNNIKNIEYNDDDYKFLIDPEEEPKEDFNDIDNIAPKFDNDINILSKKLEKLDIKVNKNKKDMNIEKNILKDFDG